MIPDMTKNPDIAEAFLYKGHTYRVEGWWKELPMTPPERDADTPRFLHEMLVEMWHESHPNPDQEHKLIPCTREEADWVSGCGVAGCLARISDIHREGEYVRWSDQDIIKHREAFLNHLQNNPHFQMPTYITKR